MFRTVKVAFELTSLFNYILLESSNYFDMNGPLVIIIDGITIINIIFVHIFSS